MKRILASALVLGVTSLFGLMGCGEEAKVETTTTTETPSGSTTETKIDKVETTGENPPPPSTPETPNPADMPK